MVIQYCKTLDTFTGTMKGKNFHGKDDRTGETVFFSKPKFVEKLDNSRNFVVIKL